MQFIAEHQFLVDIQDIITTWNIDGPLFLVDCCIILYTTQYLGRKPLLGRLTVHTFGNIKQDVSTRTTHRSVHQVDTQFTLATHQLLGIQLWEVLATVQVDNGLARIHRLALRAFITLVEVCMRRIERGLQLQFSLLDLVVFRAHLATTLSLQNVSQFGTDVTRLLGIHPFPEALDRGRHGLRLFDVVS